MTEPETNAIPADPILNGSDAPVRVKVIPEDLTYDAIKSAIYTQARYLHERSRPIAKLVLSRDLYEILNRRLVFKTPAHKEKPYFVTPFGNLRVDIMDEGLDEPLSFIVSA